MPCIAGRWSGSSGDRVPAVGRGLPVAPATVAAVTPGAKAVTSTIEVGGGAGRDNGSTEAVAATVAAPASAACSCSRHGAATGKGELAAAAVQAALPSLALLVACGAGNPKRATREPNIASAGRDVSTNARSCCRRTATIMPRSACCAATWAGEGAGLRCVSCGHTGARCEVGASGSGGSPSGESCSAALRGCMARRGAAGASGVAATGPNGGGGA